MKNKSMIKRIILFWLFFSFIDFSINAQDNQNLATLALNRAEDNFENGKLENIFNNLFPYFVSEKSGGFSREERIQAYRLITLVHLYNDDYLLAEESFKELIKADPERLPDNSDSKEFYILHEKFNIDPIFRIGIKVGANIANIVNVHNKFATVDVNNGQSKSYTSTVGLAGEVTFEYQIFKFNRYIFEIIAGLNYSNEVFNVRDNTIAGDNIAYTLKEVQNWLKAPVMIRCNYELNRTLEAYIYGGGSVNYLFTSNISGSRSEGQALTISGINLISNNLRQQFNYAIIGGVGLKIKQKTNFIVIEGRYSNGLLNVVNTSNRFSNQNLVFGGTYVDDNFSLNNISASVGYIISFYKPKKLSTKKYNKKLDKKLKEINKSKDE